MQSSSDTPHAPHTVESLLRVVEARESEVALLKLMIDKLTLQLLRARRAEFGRSSEQFDDAQIALIEGEPLDEVAPAKPSAKPDGANDAGIDRHLPAHLPRESIVHRPDATDAHRDADGAQTQSSPPKAIPPSQALASSTGVVEGVATASIAKTMAARHHVEMPIVDAVAAVVEGSSSPENEIKKLLNRPIRTENH